MSHVKKWTLAMARVSAPSSHPNIGQNGAFKHRRKRDDFCTERSARFEGLFLLTLCGMSHAAEIIYTNSAHTPTPVVSLPAGPCHDGRLSQRERNRFRALSI